MDYGYLTLVAPILTLAVAIATRKVPLAMLVGIFTGQLIICGWNPFAAINESVNGILSVCADTGNLKTFLFTALMGAFVILVRISGGVKGFVNYLTEQSKRVKSPRMAMLIAYVIGIIIFIDGLLSIMFTGVVTRPLIDKFKVSREKLAYICDATSAPVNAIIPLNSWGAMLMGLISAEIASGYIQGEPMNLLIRSLPFQFYSILSLLFVLFYIITGKDWGPMKKAELRVRNTGKLYDDGVTPLLNDNDGFEELVEEGKENKCNMMFPLITLIGGAFIGLLVTGGGNLAAGDGTTAILYSVVITLLIMCVMYTKQGIMTAKEFGDSYTSVNGERICVPYDPSTQLMFYRRDLFCDPTYKRMYFEAYRRELEVPKSFEDYNRIAGFFTRSLNPASPVQYGTTVAIGNVVVSPSEFLPRLFEQGGKLFNAKGRITVDTPEALTALKNYRETYACSDRTVHDIWKNVLEGFADGSAAMTVVFINYASHILNSKMSSIAGKLGFAPVPGGRPLSGGGVVGITRSCAHPETACAFLSWLYSNQTAPAFTLLGGLSPCRSAYSNRDIKERYPWLSAARRSFPSAQRRSGSAYYSNFSELQMENILAAYVQRAVLGVCTPEEALAQAQAEMDAHFTANSEFL